jgi:selenocysteine lyase/cysteine desulfurase
MLDEEALATELYPRLDGAAFMDHAAVARVPEPVRRAIVDMAGRMAAPVFPDSLALADRVREKVAALIGGAAAGVALTRSTSHGLSIVAAGLDWRAGDNVVTVRGEYPSNVYPWMALAPRGVALRFVEPDGGRIEPARVLEQVDERTRIVAISHVQFFTGYRVDLAALGAETRRRGVLLCVDGMQSLGALPVDVEAMRIDALASGSWKWLLGVSGMAFCYIRPDLIPALPPLIAGALTVSNRFDFLAYEPDWAPDAHRFEETWLSPIDLAGFDAALDLVGSIGIEEIERRVHAHVQRLADGLTELDVSIAPPWPRPKRERSGILTFRHAHRPAEQVLECLAAAGVVASQRGDHVRLSPHYHNTTRQIDRALDVLGAL